LICKPTKTRDRITPTAATSCEIATIASQFIITFYQGLTRYIWNFSVMFYGIIPSNPVDCRESVRKRRNHGERIVPNRAAFGKPMDSERCPVGSLKHSDPFSRCLDPAKFNRLSSTIWPPTDKLVYRRDGNRISGSPRSTAANPSAQDSQEV
jgi:hypothetical protein